MKVAIAGAGAVGLGLATTLHEASIPVRLLTRPENPRRDLMSLRLRRLGLFGDAQIPAGTLAIRNSLESLVEDPVDLILVCTKTTAIPELARKMGALWPNLNPKPHLVLCQNGWGSAQLMADEIPSSHVFSARVITGFQTTAPGSVEITAHAQPIRVGSLFGQDLTELAPLCDALTLGGIPAELSPSIDRDLWAKMLYNCALNPMGALLRVPYGEVARRPASREILECVVAEIFQVLETTPYATDWIDAKEYLTVFYRDLLPPTELHQSSMLQDLRAGRTTEIDSLCGAVARIGGESGVPTPVNSALTQLIRACSDDPSV